MDHEYSMEFFFFAKLGKAVMDYANGETNQLLETKVVAHMLLAGSRHIDR